MVYSSNLWSFRGQNWTIPCSPCGIGWLSLIRHFDRTCILPQQGTFIFELRHDKTNEVSVRLAKTQISLGIRPVWSVFAVCMKKAWVLSYPLSAQRRLIRLGGCQGWSESSLAAQSLCWFCHVAAHFIYVQYLAVMSSKFIISLNQSN